jgi:hypothetical protein
MGEWLDILSVCAVGAVGFLLRPRKDILEKIIGDRPPRIRCPKCAWEPAKHDSWCCAPGCGHVWNTFETRGHCPNCSKQWIETACLKCSVWSLHEEWYEDPEGQP